MWAGHAAVLPDALSGCETRVSKASYRWEGSEAAPEETTTHLQSSTGLKMWGPSEVV